jgi:hypothetical protein
MINWKPEGRKKQGRPRRPWKDGIYTAMSERGLVRRRKTFQNSAIYIYIYIYIFFKRETKDAISW